MANGPFWVDPRYLPTPSPAMPNGNYIVSVSGMEPMKHALQALACITLGLTTQTQRNYFYSVTDTAMKGFTSPEGMYEFMIQTAYQAKELYPDE